MRRKGNPPALLVGMQTGTAILENSVKVPQEVKNRDTYNPAIALLGIYPKDTDAMKSQDTCLYVYVYKCF